MAVLTAVAQEPATQPEPLADRVAALERRASILDRFNISGFIQAAYDWEDSGISTFHLRRARLSVKGEVYKGRRGATVDYHFQASFTSTPKIVDLWVRYRPHKMLGIQLGQFKTSLMIELPEYSQLKLELIDFSEPIRRLLRMGEDDVTGVSTAGRDMGVQLFGDLISAGERPVLSYNVAVMNGCGINLRDDNQSKDVMGRLMIRPVRNLLLSGSYMYGEGNFAESPILERFGEVRNAEYMPLCRYGGGASYDDGSIFARAEYIKGETGELLSEGAYLTTGYVFNEKTSVAARWDYFDENVADRAHEHHYTIGVNYKPWSLLRLQLNYVYKQYENMAQRGANGVRFMATVQF